MQVASALEHLAQLQGVRGRMEYVASHPSGAPIFVDYAHTPDALETVLRSLRAHTQGKLHVVFGCGGNRDAGKRPLMGKVAADFADVAIVTDDNPRSENAAVIRAAIMAAIPSATEIGDRSQAIQTAIGALQQGDALVVAGKGHETYQIVGENTQHFDDAEHIREAVEAL
jgi:UDP-N-acetylmuramoyl-L-alanyl-D-glutamate--2,6-diaminopimelate ligase